VHGHLAGGSAYHVARKRIPSREGPVPGIKLELFIFDPFPLAATTALYEVGGRFWGGLEGPVAVRHRFRIGAGASSWAVQSWGAELLWTVQVAREEHFSPVKNAPGSATDSPDTARRDVMRLHARWVRAAGARLGGEAAVSGVEVAPLLSYAGEGLQRACAGATFEEQYPAALRACAQ
jgi:UDP-N-acetylglucosamine/UDP-N-acetylgalactosamine diphosphorylase